MLAQPVDLLHLPATIGSCAHCGLQLYAFAPVAQGALKLAHVGCEVEAHRHDRA